MSRSIIKPKASVVWNEQTEKLKKKIASLVDNLCFEEGKMEEMLLKQSGSGEHEIFEIHKI